MSPVATSRTLRLLLLLLLVFAGVEGKSYDYYAILEVNKLVDTAGVRAAYKRLSRKWHPDLHEDKEEATQKMMLINEAKEVLSDPEKRESYDAMMTKFQTMNYYAQGVGGDIPEVVLMYAACPAYMSFRIGHILASIICTAMMLAHVPLMLACYFFYKYAMWGPVPVDQRDRVMNLSIPVRLFMLFVLLGFCANFMINLYDYLPWVISYVAAPIVAMIASDVFVCKCTKTERRNVGRAGSPKNVTVEFHERPGWMPYWMSFQDLSSAVGKYLESWDYNPVVEVEYTRTQAFEYRMRPCDVEEEKQELRDKELQAKQRRAASNSKRQAEEEKRRKELAQASSSSSSPSTSSSTPSKGAAPPPSSPQPSKKVVPATKAATAAPSAAWSSDQQQQFEKALKKYQAGTRDRWSSVAEMVDGKTEKQCAERFKELATIGASVKGAKK